MQRIGRIGTVVEPTITPKAKKLVVEVPIYFNQYIPGVEDSTFEVLGVFLDERAEKLNEMAQKHTKDDNPTQGKGMMVEVLGKPYTHRYKDKEGRLVKITKMYIYDVTYPNMYGNFKNNNQNTNAQQNTVPNASPNTVKNTQETKQSNQTNNKPIYVPLKEDDDPIKSYDNFVKQ